MHAAEIHIAPFQPGDQPGARALILRGLVERWGTIEGWPNPDVDDIAGAYAAGCFLVAKRGAEIVATGGFRPLATECVQVHRMSVAAEHRRRGLGARMLARLLDEARRRGFDRTILETTATWTDAVAFYESHGFRPFDLRDGDIYLELDL